VVVLPAGPMTQCSKAAAIGNEMRLPAERTRSTSSANTVDYGRQTADLVGAVAHNLE
jgi:hypothetical protein